MSGEPRIASRSPEFSEAARTRTSTPLSGDVRAFDIAQLKDAWRTVVVADDSLHPAFKVYPRVSSATFGNLLPTSPGCGISARVHRPNAHATMSGNSVRHDVAPCETFRLLTAISAPASLSAFAHRVALSRKNGSSVPAKRYTRGSAAGISSGGWYPPPGEPQKTAP